MNARLWQDPLGVAAADWAGAQDDESKAHAIDQFQSNFIAKCFGPLQEDRSFEEQKKQVQQVQSLAAQVQILAVMIPGGPYIEDVERRLRGRRAVIEGLASAGYGPENDHEIGYFWIPWQPLKQNVTDCVSTLETNRAKDEATGFLGNAIRASRNRGSGEEGSDRHSLVVPYEWCEPTSLSSRQGPAHLLVLWLNDAAFWDAPIARLADLISWFSLRLVGTHGEEFSVPFPSFAILGPDNSGTLHQMMVEAKQHPWTPQTLLWLTTTHIYSYQAWAADSLLLGEPGKCKSLLEQEIKGGESVTGFCFERINLLDNDIVRILWQELTKRRGFKKDDHVAIISEADTFYARAISSSFREEAVRAVKGLHLENVYSYTYLRGIDGKLPQKAKTGRETSETTESTDKNSQPSLQPKERPEGVGQADDIRRLAENFRKLNSGGSASIKAVGLLGSDVYDKLELLKALRPMLPEAIFFTNNLDAQLEHPDELKETHNLIVVSARDLSLEDDPNVSPPDKYHRVPPFRDGGQTALFEATLRAMGYTPPIPRSPIIFEIGRNGAKQLSSVDGTAEQKFISDLRHLISFMAFRDPKKFDTVNNKTHRSDTRAEPSFETYCWRLFCFIAFGSLLVTWIWLVSRVKLTLSKPETRTEDTAKKTFIKDEDADTDGTQIPAT
jgi:hypothetical protein